MRDDFVAVAGRRSFVVVVVVGRRSFVVVALPKVFWNAGFDFVVDLGGIGGLCP